MFLVTDRDYKTAKRARQGKRRLDPRYDGFVRAFTDRFGFPLLWLRTDHVGRRDDGLPTPRLEVVLEREAQARRFHTRAGSYVAKKQRIVAELFVDALAGVDLRPLFKLPDDAPPGYPGADELFVCFSVFERVAREDAHSSVTAEELDEFTSALDLGERFWCVSRPWGIPVVFVHTAAQAAELMSSPVRERWADHWFELARRHDEFGYLRREDIAVHVDSKENFDQNYESNWYYYFK